jgi:CRP/FNR family transcriptional regulator, cyclic AMP receptor protein
LATASAVTARTALKIGREEMIRVMHEENKFSDLFLKFLLEHSMRIQADLAISFSTPVKSAWPGFCY